MGGACIVKNAPITRKEAVIGSAVWAAILLAAGWWFFGDQLGSLTSDGSQPDAFAAEQRKLSDKELLELAMPSPALAKQIREAANRKTLVFLMRDIEVTSAAALRSTDTKEFIVQQKLATLIMVRMSQLPDNDVECVAAATDLDSLLGSVGSSGPNVETVFESAAARWRQSMPACERGVGLKPASRAL